MAEEKKPDIAEFKAKGSKLTRVQVDEIRLLDGAVLRTYVTYDEDRGRQDSNNIECILEPGGMILHLPFRSLVFWMAQNIVGVPAPPFIDVQRFFTAVENMQEGEMDE